MAAPEENVIRAPAGYQFRVGRGTMLIRERNQVAVIRDMIFAQCKRLRWPTRNLKVHEHNGVLYANVGYLRGLDPDLVHEALSKLPACCGQRKIFAALEQLEQRPTR